MLPIQRSTPAEGSVGGVGGRIHDYLEAAGHGDDEQGPLFRPIRNNRTGRIDKARVAEGRHRGAVRHVEKTRGLPPPEPARPRTPGAGADRTHAVHARLARKPGIAPTLPCRAQQERAASFPRAGHLHLQTRPDCRPQCRGAAEEVWQRVPRTKPLSVGVVLLDLVPADQHQPDLFAADTDRRQKLSPLVDLINDRYGRCSIGFGLFPADVRAFKGHAAFQRVLERWEF